MNEAARPFCYRCRHALALCTCLDAVPVPTRTRVVILQHAEEAWNQIGTARLAHLCLPNSTLIEGIEFADDARLAAELSNPEREAVLLYPTADAISLEELRGEKALSLVVVDGTWPQAKQLVKKTPGLAKLRRVKIPPGEKSRYRIRLQPRAECISTLEATVRALGAVEGTPERFHPLIEAFDRMVDRHVAMAAAAGRTIVPDVNARRARRPLPPLLAGPLESLVILQGETLWFFPDGAASRVVDLVQWTALRVATGERFEAFLRRPRATDEHEARYLELDLADIENGLDGEAFAEKWARFVRPDDVFLSWDYFASNALTGITGKRLTPHVDLRRATKHVLNLRVRRPEDAAHELDAVAGPSLAKGRAGRRLALVLAIVEELRGARGLATV